MDLIYLGKDETPRMPQGTFTIDRIPPKSIYLDRNRSDTKISETFEAPSEETMAELYAAVEKVFARQFNT